MDDELAYCVPSHGSYPVIIDFGFSFSEDMNGGPLWASLNHTDVGFTSDRFDPIADPKLFLVTVCQELHKSRKTKKLKNIVKNTFSSLPIDWDSGWDNDTKKCANDYVLELIADENCPSVIFKEYEYYCADLLTSLIILPLEKQDISSLKLSYMVFVTEYSKIESQITSPYYCLYILKGIVDIARTVRSDYANEFTRDHAINYFRFSLKERIDSIANFCKLKDIHYEKLLCSLLCLVRCIEGVIFEAMVSLSKRKRKQYRKLPLKTVEEMQAVIDINIPDTYVFNDDTTIMAIDCTTKSCRTFDLSEEETEQINDLPSFSWGEELLKIFKTRL